VTVYIHAININNFPNEAFSRFVHRFSVLHFNSATVRPTASIAFENNTISEGPRGSKEDRKRNWKNDEQFYWRDL